jgi:hypothetical protein
MPDARSGVNICLGSYIVMSRVVWDAGCGLNRDPARLQRQLRASMRGLLAA